MCTCIMCECVHVCVPLLVINPVLLVGAGEPPRLYFALMRSWQLRFILLHLFLIFPFQILHCSFLSPFWIAPSIMHLLFISFAWLIPSYVHLSYLHLLLTPLVIQMNRVLALLSPTLSLSALITYCPPQGEVLSSLYFLFLSLFKSPTSLLLLPSHFLALPLCRWLAA